MNIDRAEIINPLGDGIECVDGTVVVATTGGSMWGGGKTCDNLILFPDRHSEVEVEMTVELLPQQNGEQAGIVLFVDSDNYVKFIREMVGGEQVVVLAKEFGGAPNPEIITPFEPSMVDLHLAVAEDSISIRWGAESETFENVFPAEMEFRVGMLVHGNNAANQATFHSLRVNGVEA